MTHFKPTDGIDDPVQPLFRLDVPPPHENDENDQKPVRQTEPL